MITIIKRIVSDPEFPSDLEVLDLIHLLGSPSHSPSPEASSQGIIVLLMLNENISVSDENCLGFRLHLTSVRMDDPLLHFHSLSTPSPK